MSIEVILTLFAGIFAAGAFLDKVTTPSFRNRTGELLLVTNRQSFSAFVAGKAVIVYSAVFANRVNSWRFVSRSIVLTIVFIALGLIFLRFYFPQTYFSATSLFRNLPAEPINAWILIPPAILAILFDYVCNAQTKFFLTQMAASPSISRFLLLGYADLVSTATTAIIGLSIAYVAFLYSAYQFSTINSSISLTFPVGKTKVATDDSMDDEQSGLVVAKIAPTDRDRSLNKRDDVLLEAFPTPSGPMKLEVKYFDGNRTVRHLNDRGVAESVISERNLTIGSGRYESQKKLPDRRIQCSSFAASVSEKHFHFTVLAGWNPQKIERHCLSFEPIDLALTFRLNDDDFRYSYAATSFAGNLITISLRSLTNRFKEYLGVGFIQPIYGHENWRWNFWIGDEKPYAQFSTSVLTTAFSYHNGAFRALQGNSFPWSTFYVASIFTSLFIWIVLIFTGFLYPIVWFLEKVTVFRNFIKPQDHPFSLLAIPVAMTMLGAILVFG